MASVPPMLSYLNLLSCPDSSPISAIDLSQLDAAIRHNVLAKRALRTGDLKEALDQGSVDTHLGFGRYLEVLSLHAMVLVRAQELALALRCLVEAYLEVPGCAARFDVRTIINDVDRRPSPIAHENLERPIGFDIFSKNIDSSKDRRLAFAYSQFLRAVGVAKPSDLRPILGHFEKRKLLYFLRWICIPSIMDQFPAIEGTRALNQERIAVCQIVAELEPLLEDECFDEIKALTRKLVIYDGLKRVEQSKIYVDAESIRRALEKRLAEQFARFSALVNSAQVFNEIAQIQERKLPNQGGEPTESMSISLPTEDPASLFTSLVIEIWQEFLTGSEFSLDVYLSVRIRHGTLAGQLRSPLEALHLVTQHDGNR